MSSGPDLASLLAHMAGGGAPAPQQPQPSGLDALRQILDLAGTVKASSQLDDQDKLMLEQATTLIQRILADVQKGQDGMMAGKMDPRAVRRAAPGGQAGGY